MASVLSLAVCTSELINYKPFSSMEIRKNSLFVDCSSRNITLLDQAGEEHLGTAVAMTFSNNEMDRIDSVNAWTINSSINLVELDLSNNKISFISSTAFSSLTKL